MLIRMHEASTPPVSDITPREVWQNRRQIIAAAGGTALGAAFPAFTTTDAKASSAIMQGGDPKAQKLTATASKLSERRPGQARASPSHPALVCPRRG